MDDELIQVCALAVRDACQRMTPLYLKALDDSVEQACCLPAGFAWDRKVTAHAELVNLLADATGDPVLALILRAVPGQLYDLMSAVGPAADSIIAASRRRLMARLRAGDADGAAREMEQHLGGLLWLRRPPEDDAASDIAV
jgi:DNA-binding GntR family transcriptional regulator